MDQRYPFRMPWMVVIITNFSLAHEGIGFSGSSAECIDLKEHDIVVLAEFHGLVSVARVIFWSFPSVRSLSILDL